VNKGKISIALTKSVIQKVNEKCRRINRNRSNYIETLVLEDLQKDEPKPVAARAAEPREGIAIKRG
jgi:metal-responsive CopG/Arc/MetJ family transcriptional regulator